MNFTRVTSNGSCCWEMFGMNNGTDEIWPGDSRKLKISSILTIKSKQCNGKGVFVGKCLHRKMFAWKIIHMQNNNYYCFSEDRCTKDYPFAYRNGEYCCETNQEKVNGGTSNEVASGTCDGIGFSIESTCCKDKYMKCPHTRCKGKCKRGSAEIL